MFNKKYLIVSKKRISNYGSSDKFIFSSFFILLCVVPFFYAAAQIFNNTILYGVKDLLLLGMISVLIFYRVNIFVILNVIFIIILNLYALALSSEDLLMYVFSLREFLFYPTVGIILGYFFTKRKGSIAIFEIVVIYLLITYLYLLVFPDDSFGSTNRLKSLWDREHEPAIIGGVAFLGGWFLLKHSLLKYSLITLSIGLLLMSGSRSAFLGASLGLLVIYARNFSIFKILILAGISILLITFFSYLTLAERSIDYNITARLDQYKLAYDAIISSSFLGIGTDKYGVISGFANKQFCLNGLCTTTMDSTLLKYFVNYGLLFVLVFLFWIYQAGISLIKIKDDPEIYFLVSVFVFSIVIGLVTGKLGAYPMNLIFYMDLGAIFYFLGRKRSRNV